MASSLTLYNNCLKTLFSLEGKTVKLALVTSAYTPDITHDVLADVLSSPSPEVVPVASPDNGYTAGGETVGSPAITFTDSPIQAKFDAEDVQWTALTATFRYGILYVLGTVNGQVNPLIGYITFDTTPADIAVSGIDYVVQWSASGILTLAPSV